ncbi:MAG: glycosyltransferase family 2 protein [Candidatus Aureabacteria bacterium]|nr:glycosyltransferase family 2 protein [Candidatus Auribacterota bacterium]
MSLPEKVLIIVPAYNEQASIRGVLSRLINETSFRHVVIINDGSTDRTADIVREMGVDILNLPFNLGIGGAVQAGYKYARRHGYDYVVRIDADGQHEADSIERLLEPVVTGKADVAIGSRYCAGNLYRGALARRAGIIILSYVVSSIVGSRVTDPTSGFCAVNREVISAFCRHYPDDYPEVESIILLHRMGFKIEEVGVKMVERMGGKSSITFAESFYYMTKVLLAVGVELLRKSRRMENQ